jgi:putative pyruvate formate lyase activating enzyme
VLIQALNPDSNYQLLVSRKMESVYLKSYHNGLLKKRAEILKGNLKCCNLCPRNCRADRLSEETGICKTGEHAIVSSYNPHFGEEAPLVGQHGSGTIFFTHCNLLCNFCQNYDISHLGYGHEVGDRILADMMLSLQALGCHNINLVTPSHVVPQILSALLLAVKDGLNVPLVYNSGGYDKVSTLKMLDGIIDIYMPDFKFWDPEISKLTCDVYDYPQFARNALKEMHRQVGDLVLNDSGIAERGLLVRHLVMPDNIGGTEQIMKFIAEEISVNTYVNIMPQYRPCGKAYENNLLNRPISHEEFFMAVSAAKQYGISRLDKI